MQNEGDVEGKINVGFNLTNLMYEIIWKVGCVW